MEYIKIEKNNLEEFLKVNKIETVLINLVINGDIIQSSYYNYNDINIMFPSGFYKEISIKSRNNNIEISFICFNKLDISYSVELKRLYIACEL